MLKSFEAGYRLKFAFSVTRGCQLVLPVAHDICPWFIMPTYAYLGRLSVVVPVHNEQDNIEP